MRSGSEEALVESENRKLFGLGYDDAEGPQVRGEMKKMVGRNCE